MAEMAFGILGPAIEVVKWVAAPIKRQFSYLCCFTCNVASLKDEAKNLDYEAGKLQDRVTQDKNDGREDIHEVVETWLTDSGHITRRKERILAEATEVGLGSGCFNYAKRVSLSKEAKKTAEAMKELIQKCKFDSISRSPPIAATSPVPFGKVIYEFCSRKRFEEDIMRTLDRSKNVDKVGVWGIGGVGKTIMAQKILNRALKEGLFHEVVMVTVSQLVDKLVIQLKIADTLSLKLDAETLKPRADKLRARLMQKKRTLILLDDIWEVVNLEELGIPCDGEWCTIILTSRDKDVFKGMKVKNVCELGVLHEDEAWDFFKKMAGTCVDDVALNPIAKDVMRECKGLLIALETLGKAHEDEKRQDVWRDSLQQLRKHNPVDIPNVIKEVYRPLKLSYDRLESENAKSTILLCCLFAEDANIPLEHLTYFAMGLRLFDDTWELEGVRGRIRRSIDTLKNRCLLLGSQNEDYVRMHDVVRDVSIFIASEERLVKCSDCTWISSHVDGGARPRSCSPKLKLLLMNNDDGDQEMEINIDNLIGGSTDLNVLFIMKYNLMKSLPALKMSLTTLVLHRCRSLKSIAVVGKLESLEILICHDCDSIKELPVQVKGLKRLKLLEILRCRSLKRVPTGVISSLVGLEELKIVGTFNNWTGWEIHEEGNEATTNAGLREIEYLKKLKWLDIQVSDIALAAQPLCLSSTVVQFTVEFGKVYDYALSTKSYQRRMFVKSGDENKNVSINWGDLSTNIFLTRTECLHAHGTYDQDFNLILAAAPSIRWLRLRGFGNKKNITSAAAAFPLLDSLSLRDLPNLEEIWDEDAPIPSNSFKNLIHLKLYGLPVLKRMGKSGLSTAKDLFLQLETIEIRYSKEMEELVLVPSEEEQDQGNHISTILIFPNLKSLYLYKLPKLRSMISGSRGIESIQFPLLTEMEIEGCSNLKWISSNHDYHDDDDDDSSHLFCHPKVSFPNLEKLSLAENWEIKNVWCDKVPIAFFIGLVELDIHLYGKIRRLFSSSTKIPQNLVNLQKLRISSCTEIVKVIEDDEEVSSSSSCDHPTNPTSTTLFPSLQVLWLYCLPKLESFCEWRCALELPSLKKLEILLCDEMKSFNAGAGSIIITPTLQTVRINHRDLPVVDDLNAIVHQEFEEEEEGNPEGNERNGEIEEEQS